MRFNRRNLFITFWLMLFLSITVSCSFFNLETGSVGIKLPDEESVLISQGVTPVSLFSDRNRSSHVQFQVTLKNGNGDIVYNKVHQADELVEISDIYVGKYIISVSTELPTGKLHGQAPVNVYGGRNNTVNLTLERKSTIIDDSDDNSDSNEEIVPEKLEGTIKGIVGKSLRPEGISLFVNIIDKNNNNAVILSEELKNYTFEISLPISLYDIYVYGGDNPNFYYGYVSELQVVQNQIINTEIDLKQDSSHGYILGKVDLSEIQDKSSLFLSAYIYESARGMQKLVEEVRINNETGEFKTSPLSTSLDYFVQIKGGDNNAIYYGEAPNISKLMIGENVIPGSVSLITEIKPICYYVNGSNGNDSNSGLGYGKPVKTVSKAINLIQKSGKSGPFIINVAGTVTETGLIEITKNIDVTIMGEYDGSSKIVRNNGSDFIVVGTSNGKDKSNDQVYVHPTVSLENITIEHNGKDAVRGALVYFGTLNIKDGTVFTGKALTGVQNHVGKEGKINLSGKININNGINLVADSFITVTDSVHVENGSQINIKLIKQNGIDNIANVQHQVVKASDGVVLSNEIGNFKLDNTGYNLSTDGFVVKVN